MINKKKTMLIVSVFTVFTSLFVVLKPIYATDKSFWGGNLFSGLIEYISQKFSLDKSQVTSAVQDFQKQKKATITPRPTMSIQDRQAAEKKRLDLLVNQGKINTDQENAIIAELESLRVQYKIDQNMTPDQRKTQMQNMQNELKSWAESKQIDPNYVLGIGVGRDMGEGRGGFRVKRGPSPTITP